MESRPGRPDRTSRQTGGFRWRHQAPHLQVALLGVTKLAGGGRRLHRARDAEAVRAVTCSTARSGCPLEQVAILVLVAGLLAVTVAEARGGDGAASPPGLS